MPARQNTASNRPSSLCRTTRLTSCAAVQLQPNNSVPSLQTWLVGRMPMPQKMSCTRTVAIALHAEDSASFDRQCRSIPPQRNQRVGLLAWSGVPNRIPAGNRRKVRSRSNSKRTSRLARSCRKFISFLARSSTHSDLDLIVAERVPAQGLGAAILDRLERASHR